MFSLLRSLLTVAALLAVIIVGSTVPLGKRTLFGHIVNIWSSEEAQDLVDGVKEKSEPVVERVTKGVEAGLREARQDYDAGTPAPASGSGSGSQSESSSGSGSGSQSESSSGSGSGSQSESSSGSETASGTGRRGQGDVIQ